MRVLVVDDEVNLRESLCRFLDLHGLESVGAGNGLSAQRHLSGGSFSAAVVDLRMPGRDGAGLLAWMREREMKVPVVMMSAFGEIADAVFAMKQGAVDYLVKPFDPGALLTRLTSLITEQDFRTDLAAAAVPADDASELVGANPSIQHIRELVRRAADSPSTVLITGESGTGKEVVTRLLHRCSRRRDGAFVAVNIAGIPETLLESELFGYEKGAFTGASERRIGMFEQASGGTLFLDEIGDLSLQMQVNILRVLQDMHIRRLGGSQSIPVDVRIVAATNHDLEGLVMAGTFREDLFYRLNVVRIRIPPLRERPDDIPLLAAHVLARLNHRLGLTIPGVSAAAIDRLRAYPFPGNVRELENILERAVLFNTGTPIGAEHLELKFPASASRLPPETLAALESRAIREALHRWDGNRTRASRELGISRRTLFNKIKAYEIEL